LIGLSFEDSQTAGSTQIFMTPLRSSVSKVHLTDWNTVSEQRFLRGRAPNLLWEATDNFGCSELQDVYTFLENTVACPWVRPKEPPIHLLQGDILETKHALCIVISNNNAVHVSYPNLEAR
jgi:hypothetical protein